MSTFSHLLFQAYALLAYFGIKPPTPTPRPPLLKWVDEGIVNVLI